jgi:protein MAK11
MDGGVLLTAGSYEGHLVGFRLTEGSTLLAAAPAFALRAHDGCVRAIAGGGALLATCGSDHTISVYNVRKMREQGKLLQEGGGAALHCLAFFGDTHLVSGGGDGEMCIWRASDWECLLRMKGHKGAIHAIAIHPSGRAALSVAADSKLMLWNLTTGKCNYTTALAVPARMVAWVLDGEAYMYDTRRALVLYALRSGALLHSFAHDNAPALSMAAVGSELLISGDEAGSIRVWSLTSGGCLATAQAHERRVKALAVVQPQYHGGAASDAGGADTPAEHATFVTASSDGTLSVWRLTRDGTTSSLQRLSSTETRLRITTLCVCTPQRPTSLDAAQMCASAAHSTAPPAEGAEEAGKRARSSADGDATQRAKVKAETVAKKAKKKKHAEQ